MKKWRLSILFFCLFLFLTACSLEGNGKESNYEQTKEIVTDVLQTEDGKKVVKDLLQEESMKQQVIIDSEEVKTTLEKALKSKDSKAMWKHLFADPEFVQAFQESFADEQVKLFKRLMHDAAFQAQLLDLLQNPEMEKQMTTVLKSQETRAHLEKIIEQTFENPKIERQTYKLIQQAIDENGASYEQDTNTKPQEDSEQQEDMEQKPDEANEEQ